MKAAGALAISLLVIACWQAQDGWAAVCFFLLLVAAVCFELYAIQPKRGPVVLVNRDWERGARQQHLARMQRRGFRTQKGRA